jgi:eukaryotic-like serine/threonine-protein kinase
MPISANTTLGQYSIISRIGEGGMGEVWRARDGQLGRDVAIKILPASLSENKDRLTRFELEAQAAGALNHPNILSIYHIGTHEGTPYIVSELLEGETLRDRMAAGALSPRKATDYALQIARGLAAAHEKGVIHRDIKPDNIFITDDGRVKILDFGLAKLTGLVDGVDSQTEVPTRKVNTDPGTVMGTMGYMSPEQLKGKHVDHRSDIFSFGAILYEMLSGKRAFRGDSMAETMSAILREDPPDLSETNKTVSPALERVVRHCLEKNPAERFHSARDLAFAIESLSGSAAISGQTSPMPGLVTTENVAATGLSRWFTNSRIPLLVTAVSVVGLLAALAMLYFNRTTTPTQPVTARFLIAPPEKSTGFGQIAISPDGRHIAFNTTVDGQLQMWNRSLDLVTAKRLPGTEGSNGFMFWSPDSRSIAFGAGGKIKRLDLDQGTVTNLWDFSPDRRGFGGSWNRNGTIIFFVGGTGIFRMPATGGEARPIPGFEKSEEVLKRWPQFLPDGHHFLYVATNAQKNKSEVMVGSLEGGEPKRLFESDSNGWYVPSADGGGHIFFSRDGALLAQRFDATNLELIGDPLRVADQVRVNFNARVFFDASANGTLIFDPSSDFENRQLTWFDRSGRQLETIGPVGSYLKARLSPDQKRLALSRRDPNGVVFDLFVHDIARATNSRLTTGSSDVDSLAWSPDGNYIAWSSRQVAKSEMFRRLASGAGELEVIAQSENPISVTDWSSDAKSILYTDSDPVTNQNIWLLSLHDRRLSPYFQTPVEDSTARFSPDGRYVAYRSRESGVSEIYVQTFPASGGKWLISTNGGMNPVWAHSGKELFFIALDGKLMSVAIGGGSTFEPGKPQPVFDIAAARTSPINDYDVSLDGQRFLFISRMADATSSLAIVVNWSADPRK